MVTQITNSNVSQSTSLAKVVGISGLKSRLVSVFVTYTHPRYGKTQRREKRFMVHDPSDSSLVGDMVSLKNTRRFSKRKSAVILSVVSRSSEATQ